MREIFFLTIGLVILKNKEYERMLSNAVMLLDVVKTDKYWKRNDSHAFAEALGAIGLMLTKTKSLWPRTEGQG